LLVHAADPGHLLAKHVQLRQLPLHLTKKKRAKVNEKKKSGRGSGPTIKSRKQVALKMKALKMKVAWVERCAGRQPNKQTKVNGKKVE
jgi:hypothetical protein